MMMIPAEIVIAIIAGLWAIACAIAAVGYVLTKILWDHGERITRLETAIPLPRTHAKHERT